MEKRTLGRSNIEVSALGMGCWAIGGPFKFIEIEAGWGEVDDAESIRTVQHALASGITFFDTAVSYGAGHSEHLLGKALEGQRHRAVIATKFGWQIEFAAKHVQHYPKAEAIVEQVRAECEASLRRLNTDYIDLYQLHVWDYPVGQVPALLDVLETLVREGKIRAYGWSTDSVDGARAFAEGQHCAAIQHDLNVVKDAPHMLALCEQVQLASVNRSPLARGALTGKYSRATTFPTNDVRHDTWSWETFFEPTLEKLTALRDVLTSGGRTLTQGALAWIWARSPITVPIPGIRTVAQCTENAAAMQLGALNADQMRQIDAIMGRAAPAA